MSSLVSLVLKLICAVWPVILNSNDCRPNFNRPHIELALVETV